MSEIIYEQPLNERMRTLLRLEHLFDQLNHYVEGDTVWDNRKTISTIIDILNALERADLKTELIKEIDRIGASLKRLQQDPDVDTETLDDVLAQLKKHHNMIQDIPGRLGDDLRNDELIFSVKQRTAIPGGSCCFDLPGYHFWLSNPGTIRNKTLRHWVKTFEPIESTVRLILELIRNSAYNEEVTALGGFYQKTLEATLPCQMIRIHMDADAAYPEISGGKHRISIRFITPENPDQPGEIPFRIGCCVI